jgi:hypothetical protein
MTTGRAKREASTKLRKTKDGMMADISQFQSLESPRNNKGSYHHE